MQGYAYAGDYVCKLEGLSIQAEDLGDLNTEIIDRSQRPSKPEYFKPMNQPPMMRIRGYVQHVVHTSLARHQPAIAMRKSIQYLLRVFTCTNTLLISAYSRTQYVNRTITWIKRVDTHKLKLILFIDQKMRARAIGGEIYGVWSTFSP